MERIKTSQKKKQNKEQRQNKTKTIKELKIKQWKAEF